MQIYKNPKRKTKIQSTPTVQTHAVVYAMHNYSKRVSSVYVEDNAKGVVGPDFGCLIVIAFIKIDDTLTTGGRTHSW